MTEHDEGVKVTFNYFDCTHSLNGSLVAEFAEIPNEWTFAVDYYIRNPQSQYNTEVQHKQ